MHACSNTILIGKIIYYPCKMTQVKQHPCISCSNIMCIILPMKQDSSTQTVYFSYLEKCYHYYTLQISLYEYMHHLSPSTLIYGYECCHLYEFYQNLSLYNKNETYQYQFQSIYLTNQETQLTSDERRFRPNSAQQYLQSCDLMRTYYYSPGMLLLA